MPKRPKDPNLLARSVVEDLIGRRLAAFRSTPQLPP